MAAKIKGTVQRSTLLRVVGIVGVVGIVAGGIVGGLIVRNYMRPNVRMTIKNLRFVETKEGPTTTKSYGPGNDLYLTFDLIDIPQDNQGKMNTIAQFEVLDPSTRAIVTPVEVKVTDRPPEGTGPETPVHFHLTLPLYAPGGDYTIRILAKDAVLGHEVSQSVPFTVVGPQVASGVELGIQEHTFTAQEDGPPLTGEAVYPPGTKVQTKFSVVGFKVGPENKVKVRLDMAVLTESEEKLLDQSNVVNIDQGFFYLPLYIPVTTFVNTPPDLPSGRYRIRYAIHDDVAGTQTSLDQSFVIR